MFGRFSARPHSLRIEPNQVRVDECKAIQPHQVRVDEYKGDSAAIVDESKMDVLLVSLFD